MGTKPVFGLAGLFLASVTLTGCDTTDWCLWNKDKDPQKVPQKAPIYQQPTNQQKPPPRWDDPAMRDGPSTRGDTLPQSGPVNDQNIKPATKQFDITQPAEPPTGMGRKDVPMDNPPVDRPKTDLKPLDETSVPPPAVPGKTSAPGVNLDPPPADAPLPPLTGDADPAVDVPPPPVLAPTGEQSKTKSNYETTGPSLDVDAPPPLKGMPSVPGPAPK